MGENRQLLFCKNQGIAPTNANTISAYTRLAKTKIIYISTCMEKNFITFFYLLDELLFLLKVEETGSWYGKFFDLCVVFIG